MLFRSDPPASIAMAGRISSLPCSESAPTAVARCRNRPRGERRDGRYRREWAAKERRRLQLPRPGRSFPADIHPVRSARPSCRDGPGLIPLVRHHVKAFKAEVREVLQRLERIHQLEVPEDDPPAVAQDVPRPDWSPCRRVKTLPHRKPRLPVRPFMPCIQPHFRELATGHRQRLEGRDQLLPPTMHPSKA